MNVYFFLTEFSVTKIVSWKCHVDNSINSGYNVILGRDLLTSLVLDLNFSKNIVTGGEGLYEGYLATMVYASKY